MIAGIEVEAAVFEFDYGCLVGIEPVFVGFVESSDSPGLSVVVANDCMHSVGATIFAIVA